MEAYSRGDFDAAVAGFHPDIEWSVHRSLVVDAGTVMATHLNHALASNAADLLGADEVQALLDGLKERSPQLVAALSPAPLPLTTLTTVLKGLLSEGVPLKEFRRIASAIATAAPWSTCGNPRCASCTTTRRAGATSTLWSSAPSTWAGCPNACG